jgi:hypothetical protein
MRCKSCGYRLWNLQARRCPECGTPFRPSDFEFVCNSVEFCCPHCQQAYFGTGPKGHLVPATFTCVTCGKPVNMDEMVLRPLAGVEEEQTKVPQIPWLERSKRGGFKALAATIGMALVAPTRLMQALPQKSSVGQAWWFAAVTNFLVLAAITVPFALLIWFFLPGRIASRSGMTGCSIAGIGLLIGFVGLLLYVALWGLLAHAGLCLTGRTASGLGRTYHAILYGSGANVCSAVPLCGVYVGWIWWIVSAALMLKEAQRVHGVRAALAVLALPILSLAALGFLSWTTTAAFTASGGAASAAPVAREVATVANAIRRYASQHGGRGPEHAIQLLTSNDLSASNLVSTFAFTGTDDVPVGAIKLSRWVELPAKKADAAAQAAINALPDGLVAHRLGDFVFVYHGMNLNAADPRLWLVIESPDPGSNPAQSHFQFIGVGRADGSSEAFPASSLPAKLAAQNALRAQCGLPPIPSPETVTHDTPAVLAPSP